MKLFMKDKMEKLFLQEPPNLIGVKQDNAHPLMQSNFDKLLRQILIDNYKASLEQGTNKNEE